MPTANCGYPDPKIGAGLLVQLGRSLWVNIGFDPTYKPTLNAPPTPGIANVEALVDTGADESCIDSQLATQLRLPIIDQRLVRGVHGIKSVNMHVAQVHIPALKFTQYGQFAAVDLAGGGQRLRALIGRTLLRHFRMVYEGTSGVVTITSEP
jgi:predicted aspartyl protease